MQIGPSNSKYELVRKQLIEWLGTAKAGDRMLAERQLAQTLGVSRPTIRRAVDDLVQAGLLVRSHGSGVYVNKSIEQSKKKICMAYASEIPAIHQPILNIVWQQLELEVSGHGNILLTASVNGGAAPSALMEADGLLVMSELNPSLLPQGKPAVVLFDPGYNLTDTSYVLIDDYLGGLKAAKHLISLGHKNLAFVGDLDRYLWARERYRGVCDAALDSRLAKPALIQIDSNNPFASKAAKEVKDGGYTGVVCANDYIAMSIISSVHKKGLRVPEDISIVGFDDIPNAAFFEPPLTTVKLPVREAVSIALNELSERIDASGRSTPKRITLPAELVLRSSTRAAQ